MPTKSTEKLKYEYTTVESSVIKYGFGVRHIQVLLVFICLSVAYIMRVSMSPAILAMTDEKSFYENVEIFVWDKNIQGIILTSFFWGYTVMQIPAGQLAHRYGAKPLLTVAMVVNGGTCLILPWAVHKGGWQAIVSCRVLQGLTQACFFPCIHTMASRWIPVHERSRLTNLLFAGTPFGTILGMPLSAILGGTSYGWPCIFYTFGALGLITSVLWIVFGASSPADHTSISKEEKLFILSSLGHTDEQKPLKMPWRSIATSLPIWAIAIAHCGCNWGFVTLFTNTPTYMKLVLGIDTKKSGILSAMPYMAMWLGSILFSFVSDFIVNNNICTATVSRKTFNTIGTWCPAVGLIVLSYIPPGHEIIAIAILTVTVGIGSGMNMGYMMNHIDLAPNFAGTLMAITNCIANGIGMLAPLTLGWIIEGNDTDPAQWRLVFFITSCIYFVTNLFFIIFATSKRQPWNEPNIFGDVEMKQKI